MLCQIEANAIFGLTQHTNSEMLSVISPNKGSMVYNTDDDKIYKFDGSSWVPIEAVSSLKSIVLNRTGGYTLPTGTNRYFDFPINASNIQSIDPSVFSVVANGTIRILEAGTYLIAGGLSTSNMPSGSTKYIIGAFRNGVLIGYLTRGFVTLPNDDWWGGTGFLMYNFNANDTITLRYVLNAGRTLTGRFMNVGISKVN